MLRNSIRLFSASLGETRDDGSALRPHLCPFKRKRFAAYEAWQTRRRGEQVSPLGFERVRTLAMDGVKESILAPIARDKAFEDTANGIESVDRLVHYYQHLSVLLNNFVSLHDFYTPDRKAIFQAGTLTSMGAVVTFACGWTTSPPTAPWPAGAAPYLAYCQCRRRGGEDNMTIAAAGTAGDADNLMEGRNGLFYDRKGTDWDATIVKIIPSARR